MTVLNDPAHNGGNEELGDVQSIVEVAAIEKAMTPVHWEPGAFATWATPPGWSKHQQSLEYLLPNPNRMRGTVSVHTGESFVEAVKQRTASTGLLFLPESIEFEERDPDEPDLAAAIIEQFKQSGAGREAPMIIRGSPEQLQDIQRSALRGPLTVYADEANSTLVAVLNDDWGTKAGWRDMRVELRLRVTPEWAYWKSNAGLHDQARFAEIIDGGMPEIRDPSGAQMLEIAETFTAHTDATFSGGVKVANGQRQIVWQETTTAKAGGERGAIDVPDEIILGVKPFVGSNPYRVVAKLRYKVVQGKITIGYVLDRPVDTERAAFLEQADKVGEGLGITIIQGEAPAAATADSR